MENEKFDEITMKENVESNKVSEYYHKALDDTRYLIAIPLIFFIISSFVMLILLSYDDNTKAEVFCVFAILSFIAMIICKVIRSKKISFYKELYKIAKKNDAIRHDEKVRHFERKRLEQKYNNEFNIKNIQETLNHPKELKTTHKRTLLENDEEKPKKKKKQNNQ